MDEILDFELSTFRVISLENVAENKLGPVPS